MPHHLDCPDLPSLRDAATVAIPLSPTRSQLTPPPYHVGDDYDLTLKLFAQTLNLQERPRPDIHGAMLRMADRELILRIGQAVKAAWLRGERIWLTADLHLGHRNVLDYCDRPFGDVESMDDALLRQLGKVSRQEWLIIVGDVAMGDHTLSFPLLRQVPGRKVLVVGNHDITRAGHCHYASATKEDGSPLFEAVVPFLHWTGHGDQPVVVSHYPVHLSEGDDSNVRRASDRRELPLLNYHGHLHRNLLPHSAQIQYINVGWDVTQGMVCL